ncbi:Retrovirus-related Pol poly, partial [Paramuricea clavata]
AALLPSRDLKTGKSTVQNSSMHRTELLLCREREENPEQERWQSWFPQSTNAKRPEREVDNDYDTVKEFILKGYELVPEAYRQKFRNLEKNINKTYVQFAQEKEQLFDRWCLSEDINKEYKRLRELMLLEEFKRCINNDIRTFINEQKPKDLTAAARLADEYSLTHKFSTNKTQTQSFSRGNNNSNSEGRQPPRNFPRSYPENLNGLNNGEGHTMTNCFKLKNKEAKGQQHPKPTGLLSNDSNNNDRPSVSDQNPFDHVDPIMKVFQPFVFDGSVSFQNDESAISQIKILRDTGASQSLVLTNTLPFSKGSYSGKNALIKGIDAQKYTSVPLHNINLQSKLVSGEVQIGNEADAAKDPICYFMKNGILMRKWRPSTVPVNEEWLVRYQIVIPKTYRPEVLSLAHETPLSGHLGINKTYQKIITHFYWTGIRKDVVEFCKTCHTCQVVGKPNQTIPKAPLKPIPAFDEPFSRILIDCVGPLPKTKKGNQYLLTIMCASTRFPEAIPLRNIKTKTIVQALTKFFTLVGLPKSIQSDQGSNFMSGIFQQVMHELKIKQYKSTAYHPESQGALERFHQTLKRMMRTYCLETEKDWDDGVHLLLFAARESVQESLGFSPFELVFGHTVRGPLNLLKEKLLSASGNSLDLSQYVSDFRTKLSKACELAKANLQSAQKCMKNQYDKNCVSRTFQPGDKVLALLPVPGNTLQARYFGPYLVEKKENDLNYVIVTPDRRKNKQLCHVNMLKSYYERKNGVQVVNVIDVENTNIEDTTELFNLSESTKLHNSDVLRNMDTKLSHLSESQRRDIEVLVQEYQCLFPDVPSRTDHIAHDVEINDVNIYRPICHFQRTLFQTMTSPRAQSRNQAKLCIVCYDE